MFMMTLFCPKLKLGHRKKRKWEAFWIPPLKQSGLITPCAIFKSREIGSKVWPVSFTTQHWRLWQSLNKNSLFKFLRVCWNQGEFVHSGIWLLEQCFRGHRGMHTHAFCTWCITSVLNAHHGTDASSKVYVGSTFHVPRRLARGFDCHES